MSKRTRTPSMRKVLSEIDHCELCGSRRGLEVHHIIPVACGGPEDDIDNLIVICASCHARLTPRKILTRIGIDRCLLNDALIRINKNFYDGLLNENIIFASEACDVFNKVMWDEVHRVEARNARREMYDYKRS